MINTVLEVRVDGATANTCGAVWDDGTMIAGGVYVDAPVLHDDDLSSIHARLEPAFRAMYELVTGRSDGADIHFVWL